MKCPKCDSENVAPVGPLMRCRSCEHYFSPPAPAEPAPEPAIFFKPDSRFNRTAVEKLRRQADSFTSVAVFCIIIAIIGLVCAIGGADVGWAVFGCGIGLATWLYLLAQIIHIRANTEK